MQSGATAFSAVREIHAMKFYDVQNAGLLKAKPDAAAVLLSEGSYLEQGFVIRRISLCQYLGSYDARLGQFSLITAVVETDRGAIEITYDEGYRGNSALSDAQSLLVSSLGLSSLILRAVISLRGHLHIDAKSHPC